MEMGPVVQISLLKKKDVEKEEILKNFLTDFESEFESRTDPSDSADLRQQNKLRSLKKSLSSVSMLAAQRYMPILKKAIVQQEEDHLENMFAHIRATPLTTQQMALKYHQCFNAFFTSPDISFETHNTDLLKNIDIRDQYVLTLWSMITVRRQAGDNLLQLICSGKSSTGNTLNKM